MKYDYKIMDCTRKNHLTIDNASAQRAALARWYIKAQQIYKSILELKKNKMSLSGRGNFSTCHRMYIRISLDTVSRYNEIKEMLFRRQ